MCSRSTSSRGGTGLNLRRGPKFGEGCAGRERMTDFSIKFFEFADVVGLRPIKQKVEGRRRYEINTAPHSFRVFLGEMAGEKRYIFGSLAKGPQRDRKDFQAL